MTNVFDYLRWRGDLSFEENALNPVDALIFSVLSYIPFDDIVTARAGHGKITLAQAAGKLVREDIPVELIRSQLDLDLLYACAASNRFGPLILSAYENRSDFDEEKQFSAITFDIQKNLRFIAFRGTDLSLVGWKEDFNMSFMTPVPSQTEALAYLESVADSTRGALILGGHSKGGNLAVYSAAFASSAIQKRITEVFTNDGPGFHAAVIAEKGFKRIEEKISAFVPEASIIGMLLEHNEEYTIVASSVSGFLQHDPYSWSVIGPDFERKERVDDSSRFIDRTISDWLAALEPAQRELFIDSLWEIITVTEARTISDFATDWLRHAHTIIKTFVDVDPETRKVLLHTTALLFRTARKNISAFLSDKKEKKDNGSLS